MIKKDYTFGLILIFIGVIFLFLNAKILSLNWMLFILGIGFLAVYFFKRQIGYLSASLVLLSISIVSLIDEYVFKSMNIKGFAFLWIIGIISLVLYFKSNSRGYLIFGCLLPAIGTFTLIDNIYVTDVVWIFFILLGIAFYIIYFFEYKKNEITWPRTLSIILFILSLMFLLSSTTLIKFKFWKVISYVWPIVLILIGIKIIYNMFKLKE